MQELAEKHCEPKPKAEAKDKPKIAPGRRGRPRKVVLEEDKNLSHSRANAIKWERENKALKGSNLTAKELQDRRNAEYFERVKAGLVDDNPPMPVSFQPVMFGSGLKLLD